MLKCSHDNIKAENKDIKLIPNKLIGEARWMKIADIINGSSTSVKVNYFKIIILPFWMCKKNPP